MIEEIEDIRELISRPRVAVAVHLFNGILLESQLHIEKLP